MGEELVLSAVGDPDRGAIGPDATRRAVALVELELAVLDALAAGAVVGVDRVAGAVRVVGDPQRRAVRPHTGGPVVAAVQLLDVAVDGPLEVDLARGGAATAAAAATADEGDHWSYTGRLVVIVTSIVASLAASGLPWSSLPSVTSTLTV